MQTPKPNQAFQPVVNRLADVAIHTSRYSFKGRSRLARDTGINPATMSRLWRGQSTPTFTTVAKIISALEQQLGRRLHIRDVFACDGEYLTPFVCTVAGCSGCLPDQAYDEFGDRTPKFQSVRPGEWVSSRYPEGVLNA